MSRWAVLLIVLGTMAGCSTLGPSGPLVADNATPAMMSSQTAGNEASGAPSSNQEVSRSARAREALPDDPVQAILLPETASTRSGAASEDTPTANSKPVVNDLTSDPLGPLPKVRLWTRSLRTPEMEDSTATPRQAEQKAGGTDIRSVRREAGEIQVAARDPGAPLPVVDSAEEKLEPLGSAVSPQDQGAAAVPAGASRSPRMAPAGRPCARLVGGIDAEPSNTHSCAKPAMPGARCLSISARPADGQEIDKAGFSSLACTEPAAHAGSPLPGVSANPGVHFVNSKRFRLNYEVKDVGPSGIGSVELWYTQDGRAWQKHNSASHQHSPYVVEVGDEDLYGFTLLVRSGAGVAKQPPGPGDPPQVWVAVDVTKPVVRLLGAEPGTGPRAGTLTVLWTASDKNLNHDPVTISYAEQAAGPWLPIATRLPNTGRYVSRIPPGMPLRFLVRVEAADQAGNVGMDQSRSPILADPAQPTVAILNVEPARR